MVLFYFFCFRNPNEPNPIENVEWPPYTKETQKYLHITTEMTPESVKRYLFGRRANLWRNIIPSLMKACSVQGTQKYCEKDGECPSP